MRSYKPFVRKHKSGVSHIVSTNYDTNKFGMMEKGSWYKLSKEICERDNFRCIWCKVRAATVHHIIPRSRNGTNARNNLACICDDCHEKRPYHKHMHGHAKPKFVEPF